MNKTAVLLILFFMYCVQSNSQTSDQIQSRNLWITRMLDDFYTEYVTAQEQMPADQKKVNSILKQYCTKIMISKQQKSDYDLFLNAQDVTENLLNTLEIAASESNPDVFEVSYLDTYKQKRTGIKLLIEEHKGKYKIADVL